MQLQPGTIETNTWKKFEASHKISLRSMTGPHHFTSNKNLLQFTNLLSQQDDALRQIKILAHTLQTSKFPHLSRLTI